MNDLKRTAAQTALLMAILTLVSKAFGFIREMCMAYFFGTSYITDALVVALAIPGIIFGGIFGSVATAYMPLFSKIIETDGERAGSKFTSEVINLLFIVSIVASIFGILFSDQIVSIFASGFTGETARLASYFTKISLCFVLFTTIAGVIEAYLQYKGIFLIQIVLGYVQNIIIIIVIIFSALTSHYYLAFGWLLAYMARLIIIIILAKKRGLKYYPVLKLNETIRKIILISFPVFVANGIAQINSFVDKAIASGLPEGSVSALNYGTILIVLITGLTISILTTILYPKLNHAFSRQDYARLSDMMGMGVTLIAIVAIPCTLGAMVYSNQIVQIVYERGAFDPVATSMTSTAFFYYSIGLLFMSFNELIIRAYYSMHDMKTPMIYAGIGVIINVVLNLILVRFMAHGGLALATSISYIATSVMLFVAMKKKYSHINLLKSWRKIFKIITAAIISVGSSYLIYTYVIMPLADIIYIKVLQLGIVIVAAGLIYLGMLLILKVEEVKMIKKII